MVDVFASVARYCSRFSTGTRDQSYSVVLATCHLSTHRTIICAQPSNSWTNSSAARGVDKTYLIEIDNRLPEMVALLVEISHTDLSEVTWMVLIHVGTVVMLSSCQTTSTGMLSVLSYTTVTGGNVSAAVHLLAHLLLHPKPNCLFAVQAINNLNLCGAHHLD